MTIDTIINGFSPNKVRIHLHIWDNSVITFLKTNFCLGSSKTSHVDSLDRSGKVVVEKVHNAIDEKVSQEDKRN